MRNRVDINIGIAVLAVHKLLNDIVKLAFIEVCLQLLHILHFMDTHATAASARLDEHRECNLAFLEPFLEMFQCIVGQHRAHVMVTQVLKQGKFVKAQMRCLG